MKKILDNDYYDLLTFNALIPEGYGEGDNVTRIGDRFSLLHISKSDINPCDLSKYIYFEFPKRFLNTYTSFHKHCLTEKTNTIILPQNNSVLKSKV